MGVEVICVGWGLNYELSLAFNTVTAVPRATLCETSPVSREERTLDALSPPANTLAAREVGYSSQRLSREGLISIPGLLSVLLEMLLPVFGAACSSQLSPPRPALLLPEQLSSLACKGNESAAPALLWVQTRGPRSRHTDDPCAAQPPAEKQEAVTIADGAAPFPEVSLAVERCFAPVWRPRCRWQREGSPVQGTRSLEPSSQSPLGSREAHPVSANLHRNLWHYIRV